MVVVLGGGLMTTCVPRCGALGASLPCIMAGPSMTGGSAVVVVKAAVGAVLALSGGGSVSDGAAPEGALNPRMKAAVNDATASPNNERICPKDTRS